MSASPVKSGAPLAPYVEDCDDDSQDEPLQLPPPTANVARKVTRRDEASDSGYSSHTVATGSSSQGSRTRSDPPHKSSSSSNKPSILKVLPRMGRRASASPKKEPSKASPARKATTAAKVQQKAVRQQQSLSRRERNDDIRAMISEGREEAAKMRTSGAPPVELKISQRPALPPPEAMSRRSSEQRSPTATRPTQSIAIPRPALTSRPALVAGPGRPRPFSYHGPPPVSYPYHYAQQQPMVITAPFPQQSYPGPGMAYMPAPGPGSPNRTISYGGLVRPTQPPQPPASYFQHQHQQQYPHAQGPYWPSHQQSQPMPLPASHPYYQQPAPYPTRRLSVVSPPSTIVEYPQVPQPMHQPPMHQPPLQPLQPPQPPHHLMSSYHNGMSTPVEAPDDLFVESPFAEEDEAYYRDLHRRQSLDRAAMPPPPVPVRPGYPRAATTSAAQAAHILQQRNPDRYSIELPARSPRKTSSEESQPQSRPGLSSRTSTSYSSGGSSNRNMAIVEAPPSPTALRRRSRPISRPVSYHDSREARHEKQIEEAEHYQDAQLGNGARLELTADTVHKLLRQKSNTKTPRSSRSETASRTSSKSSDLVKKKDKRSSAEKARDRKAVDEVTMQIGKTTLGMHRGSIVKVRNGDEDFEVRLGEKDERRHREGRDARDGKEVREARVGRETREGREHKKLRERDREREPERKVKYISAGSGQGEVEVSRHRLRSRSRVPHKESNESNSATVGDGELLERFKRRTESRSRRSSRSGVSVRSGHAIIAPAEGEAF